MVSPDVSDIRGSFIPFAEPIVTLPAFSEHVPVVHIVGTPSTLQLKTKPMLHHTLGDGRFVNSWPTHIRSTSPPVILITHRRFDAYQKAAEQFTISQAYLTRPENADIEIDRVLTDCLILVCHNVPVWRPTLLTWDNFYKGPAGVSLSSHRCSI